MGNLCLYYFRNYQGQMTAYWLINMRHNTFLAISVGRIFISAVALTKLWRLFYLSKLTKLSLSKMKVFLYIFVVTVLLKQTTGISTQVRDACPGIVSREEWGGRLPEHLEYRHIPVENVIIQHTVTPRCSSRSSCSERVRNMQTHHMVEFGYDDIGLSFMIGDDGDIYEGPGWYKVGAHTFGYNYNGIAIAFIGTFENKLPTQKALQAAKGLLKCGLEKKLLTEDYKLYGHLQVNPTASPGQRLYQEIKKWPHWTQEVKKQ